MPVARCKTMTPGAIGGVLAPLGLTMTQAVFPRSTERPVVPDSISEWTGHGMDGWVESAVLPSARFRGRSAAMDD
jgi:hypothetical protein